MANPSIYKMSDATLVRFIELYRSEELLWNTNHRDYKTKDLRCQAVERIANQLNITGFGPAEVVHKFKNVRSSYCHELKRIHLSIQRGDDEIYKPKVVWFNIVDSFLKPYCQVQLQGNGANGEENAVELIQINNSQLVKVSSNFEIDVGIHDYGNAVPNGKKEPLPEVQLSKRYRMDNPEYVALKRDSSSDDYDSFGRYVAAQLRELSTEYALQAQCAILQCLAEERVNFYESSASVEKDE